MINKIRTIINRIKEYKEIDRNKPRIRVVWYERLDPDPLNPHVLRYRERGGIYKVNNITLISR